MEVAQKLVGDLAAAGESSKEEKARLAGPAARLARALNRLSLHALAQRLAGTFSLM